MEYTQPKAFKIILVKRDKLLENVFKGKVKIDVNGRCKYEYKI